jgi:hypothetical protein
LVLGGVVFLLVVARVSLGVDKQGTVSVEAGAIISGKSAVVGGDARGSMFSAASAAGNGEVPAFSQLRPLLSQHARITL